jgi:hypothetical protein
LGIEVGGMTPEYVEEDATPGGWYRGMTRVTSPA